MNLLFLALVFLFFSSIELLLELDYRQLLLLYYFFFVVLLQTEVFLLCVASYFITVIGMM